MMHTIRLTWFTLNTLRHFHAKEPLCAEVGGSLAFKDACPGRSYNDCNFFMHRHLYSGKRGGCLEDDANPFYQPTFCRYYNRY
jgi:hypothetical protein